MLTATADPLEAVVSEAFARTSELTTSRIGPFVVGVRADAASREQGFERALLPAGGPADFEIAIVSGDIPALQRHVPEPREHTFIASGDRFFAHWRPEPEPILSVYDRLARRGVTWFPDAVAPPWAVGQPFVPVTHAAAVNTGWCVAHAAAVGHDGRFLLLAGPGRSGKSTAALACALAGWDYAGDDLVLIDPSRRLVAPMFLSARVRESGRAGFSDLVSNSTFAITDDDGANRYELRLPLEPVGGEVAALLVVRRTGHAPFELQPARGADVVHALMRHSISRAPGYAETTTRKLLGAARMAPTFIVDTGNDPAAIPHGFAQLLEQLP